MPRFIRAPRKRDKSKPPLGSQAMAHRRRLASLGLSRRAWIRRPSTARYEVLAKYLTDNWRAYRTWGVSAISPWQHEFFWKAARRRRSQPQESCRRLGESPAARIQPRLSRPSDTNGWIWRSIATIGFRRAAAKALYRNNLPLLGLHRAASPKRFHKQGSQLLSRRNDRKATHHHQQFAPGSDRATSIGRYHLPGGDDGWRAWRSRARRDQAAHSDSVQALPAQPAGQI